MLSYVARLTAAAGRHATHGTHTLHSPMLPKLVIVGRPNVGKSSLLNLLAGRRVSIVEPTAGVTRDRVSTVVTIPSPERDTTHKAEVIDTGGLGLTDNQQLTPKIERQIAQGLGQADLILFVVDAQAGITPLDETVARLIRTSGANKPVLLIANKIDDAKHEPLMYDAMQLGFGEPIPLAAITGRNKHELYDRLYESIDFSRFTEDANDEETGPLIALVGKRNAGKSTMVNALAGEERVIVSEIEGTTRDAVDVRFEMDGRVFTAIDTAGVRKRKSLADDIEYYSMHRALRSVRRADVCLLLIDATVPVSQVDRKLVNEINEHYRPTVIVVNKWDLAEDKSTQEAYVEYLDKELAGLSFAPIVFTFASRGEGMREAIGLAMNLYEQARHRTPTAELNRAVQAVLAQGAPRSKLGKQPKIYYATQTDIDPPTIAIFVNAPELFDKNYLRFFVNHLRDLVAYSEVPIRIMVRGKQHVPEDAEI
ncbi:MAG: ribosome biogenesis GTPase Der [Phycisphaeraceae bacterium]